MPKKIDITGQRFSKLLVLNEEGRSNDGKVKWLCKCDCGTTVSVSGTELRSGGTRSCGCLASELIVERNRTHGLSTLPEYKIWKGIKKRCYNKNETHYDKYGGRGIVMCDEWKDSFIAFYEYIGSRPSLQHSIDRIDNNGNYEHGNVKWSTKLEQSVNRRFVKKYKVGDEEKTIPQIARELGISASTLYSRAKANAPLI